MSAFVCATELFEDVVNYVFHNNLQNRFTKSKDTSNKAKRRFANRLYNLNVTAVCQRYSDDRNSYSKPYFDFDTPIDTKKVFDKSYFYKRLACLTYQCAEGTVPELKLYKALDTLEEEIKKEGVKYKDLDPWG